METGNKLPSTYQIGDRVTLPNFTGYRSKEDDEPVTAIVIGVSFTASKVKYDVETVKPDRRKEVRTRPGDYLEGIDSLDVAPAP